MIKKVFLLAFTAFLIAMAIPSSRARLQQEVFKPIMDDVNGRLVPARLTTMADQLDFRLGLAEGFPGNWESWLRRDFSGSPQDPWGNTYYLQIGRRDYTVGSAAGDGEEGTEDDITVTRRLPGGR